MTEAQRVMMRARARAKRDMIRQEGEEDEDGMRFGELKHSFCKSFYSAEVYVMLAWTSTQNYRGTQSENVTDGSQWHSGTSKNKKNKLGPEKYMPRSFATRPHRRQTECTYSERIPRACQLRNHDGEAERSSKSASRMKCCAKFSNTKRPSMVSTRKLFVSSN